MAKMVDISVFRKDIMTLFIRMDPKEKIKD